MKIKLTKTEANEIRDLLVKARQNLSQVENMLVHHHTEEEIDEITEEGDDPLSNVISAVETTSEALGDISPGSKWIEIIQDL